MFDQDVVIIGGGPAGLAAGTLLSNRGLRVLLLEKENFGGYLKKVERFNGHPDYPAGVSGPELAEKLIEQAAAGGLQMIYGVAVEIESYASCKSVTCADGKNYTASAVIIAGGRQPKKLGVPGEAEYLNRGVIHCVLCDAGLYHGMTVAICGGGNTGVSDALLMARHAARVIVIERSNALSAIDKLRELAAGNPKLECLYGSTIERIMGDQAVEAIEVKNLADGEIATVPVDGVVIDVGYIPDTAYLEGVIPLDASARVAVNESNLQSKVDRVFAAGDIRSNTSWNLIGAIRDGEKAASAIMELLELNN